MDPPERPGLSGLTLTVTEQCNLRCSYCHAQRSHRSMSEGVADAAVDLLMRSSQAAPLVTLSFYGGEPFLYPQRLARALARARTQARPGQAVRSVTPSNGLLLTDAVLELCAQKNIELAISIDGLHGKLQRPLPDGRDSTPELLARLPAILASGRADTTLARMTVTPSNVTVLCRNVQSVARLGFGRIVYQPAWELAWDAAAVAAWRREHERIVTWLAGARALGGRLPRLPALESIEARLRRGKARTACGAGVRFCAVATDGTLVPCYRFVFDGTERRHELGNVFDGFTHPGLLEQYQAFSPEAQRPEHGSCEDCAARDGCTQSCPALGQQLLSDLHAVPASVCALMQAQVEVVRKALGAPVATRGGRPRTA